jgi:hypothetical protein
MNSEALWGLASGSLVAVVYFILSFIKKGRKEGEPKVPDIMWAGLLGGALPAGGIMLYAAIVELCHQSKTSKLEAAGGIFYLGVFLGGIVKTWDLFRPLVKPYFKKKRKKEQSDPELGPKPADTSEPAAEGD